MKLSDIKSLVEKDAPFSEKVELLNKERSAEALLPLSIFLFLSGKEDIARDIFPSNAVLRDLDLILPYLAPETSAFVLRMIGKSPDFYLRLFKDKDFFDTFAHLDELLSNLNKALSNLQVVEQLIDQNLLGRVMDLSFFDNSFVNTNGLSAERTEKLKEFVLANDTYFSGAYFLGRLEQMAEKSPFKKVAREIAFRDLEGSYLDFLHMAFEDRVDEAELVPYMARITADDAMVIILTDGDKFSAIEETEPFKDRVTELMPELVKAKHVVNNFDKIHQYSSSDREEIYKLMIELLTEEDIKSFAGDEKYQPEIIQNYLDSKRIEAKDYFAVKSLENLDSANLSDEELVRIAISYLKNSSMGSYYIKEMSAWERIKEQVFKVAFEEKAFEDESDYKELKVSFSTYWNAFGLAYVLKHFKDELLEQLMAGELNLTEEQKTELKAEIKKEFKSEASYYHHGRTESLEIGLFLGLFTDREVINLHKKMRFPDAYYAQAPEKVVEALLELEDFDRVALLGNPHITSKQRNSIIKKAAAGWNKNFLFNFELTTEELDLIWDQVKDKETREIKETLFAFIGKNYERLSDSVRKEVMAKVIKLRGADEILLKHMDKLDDKMQAKVFTNAIATPESALDALTGGDFDNFLSEKNVKRAIDKIKKDKVKSFGLLSAWNSKITDEHFTQLFEGQTFHDITLAQLYLILSVNDVSVNSKISVIESAKHIYANGYRDTEIDWNQVDNKIIVAISKKIDTVTTLSEILSSLSEEKTSLIFSDKMSNDYWMLKLRRLDDEQTLSLSEATDVISYLKKHSDDDVLKLVKESIRHLKGQDDIFLMIMGFLLTKGPDQVDFVRSCVLGRHDAHSIETVDSLVNMILDVSPIGLIESVQVWGTVKSSTLERFLMAATKEDIEKTIDTWKFRSTFSELEDSSVSVVLKYIDQSLLDSKDLSIHQFIETEFTNRELANFLERKDIAVELIRMNKELKAKLLARMNSIDIGLNSLEMIRKNNDILGYSSEQLSDLLYRLNDESIESLVTKAHYAPFLSKMPDKAKDFLFGKIENLDSVEDITALLVIAPKDTKIRAKLISKCTKERSMTTLLSSEGTQLSEEELEMAVKAIMDNNMDVSLSLVLKDYRSVLLNAYILSDRMSVKQRSDREVVVIVSTIDVAVIQGSEFIFSEGISAEAQSFISNKLTELINKYPETITGYYMLRTNTFSTKEAEININIGNVESFSDDGKEMLAGLIRFTTVKKLKAVAKRRLNISSASPLVTYDVKIDVPVPPKPRAKKDYEKILKSSKTDIYSDLDKIVKVSPSRRFGFELELSSDKAKGSVADAIRKSTDTRVSEKSGYEQSKGGTWDLKFDSSVRAVNGYAMELASPILTGEEGIAEAKNVLDSIFKKFNIVTGQSTNGGLHIHHEVKDLLKIQSDVNEVMSRFYMFQESLYQLIDGWRQHNNYCSRLKIESIDRKSYGLGSRSGFNLTDRGTMEFRMKESLGSSESIIRWIKVTQKLVDTVATGLSNQVEKFKLEAKETLEVFEKERIIQLKEEEKQDSLEEKLNRYSEARAYSEALLGIE